MLLYNISDFLTLVKEDLEIMDLVLPVDDTELLRRLDMSALRDFSMVYPRIVTVRLREEDRIIDATDKEWGSISKYKIPEKYYKDTVIMSVLGLMPTGYGYGANLYVPAMAMNNSINILESMSDIMNAATLGASMTHSPTLKFEHPDILTVYSGWLSTEYDVEIALKHDMSLATIPPSAMGSFRELAILDLKEFLYGKLKRLDNLELGIGNINLRIDDWSSARGDKRDLLQRWREKSALDTERAIYF